MALIDVLLTTAALPVTAASSYLGWLALLARTPPPPPEGSTRLRFDIVVPAHNEESDIETTVRSLRAIDYPADRFRIIVVADNCTDATASRAESAGAQVLARQDAEHRGKGYALAFGFNQSLTDGFAEIVAVVDADTVVTPNLLRAFASRFEAGARAVQADYGVRNPGSSWRTRLMTIALAAFHGVRSVARERLGLSCGLRGNGMAFTADLLKSHPPRAFSIVEDLEYGLQLAYEGIRVGYVHEATVRGYMAASERDSRAQRRRWERGRKALVREHVPQLLARAWHQRDLRLLDLAIDLLVPPIGTLAVVATVGLILSLVAGWMAPSVWVAPWFWGSALGGIMMHVLQGWRFSKVGARGILDLAWAPVYVIWKLSLRFGDRGREPREWVRTRREVRP